jgi:tRNA U34 5-methylaminomethyl-2-thiouridine-forming methyltransferase MnmC
MQINSESLKVVSTSDGSKTIYNPQVNENYHSKHGALQESMHVFVNMGLSYFLKQFSYPLNEVSILEVGFGTGLNFLLSANLCTQKNINLNYTGIEAFPLTQEMIIQTEYNEYVNDKLWDAYILNYPKTILHTTTLNDFTKLKIQHSSLLNYQSTNLVDIIYFDAFAKLHQPEMWSLESLTHTIKFLKPGGVFVTYAITGDLKRMLIGLGMQIEKVKGAPGKREMLRAIKLF